VAAIGLSFNFTGWPNFSALFVVVVGSYYFVAVVGLGCGVG